MKENTIQKYHFLFSFGEEIHRTSDEHGDIVVYDKKGERILTFDSLYEQSRIKIDDPYDLCHEYMQALLLPLFYIKPQHVVLLGLGGGAALRFLYHVKPDARLTAIEHRQSVIDVAYQYFGLPESSRIQIRCQNARDWLENVGSGITDMMLADLYHADGMNDLQSTESFFWHCSKTLTNEGWLSLNYHHKPMLGSPTMNALSRHFASVFMVCVNTDNWIVMACKKNVGLEDVCHPNFFGKISPALRKKIQFLQKKLCQVSGSSS